MCLMEGSALGQGWGWRLEEWGLLSAAWLPSQGRSQGKRLQRHRSSVVRIWPERGLGGAGPGAKYPLLPLDQPVGLIHFGRSAFGGRDVPNETSDENAGVLGLQIACVLNSPFVRRGRNKGGGLAAGAQRGL